MKQALKYSELRKQPRIDLAAAVPLPMPLSMYIDPCSLCNYRCIFCPQSSSSSREMFATRMDMDSFVHVVNEIAGLGALKTCNLFSFGEPLLNPLTPDFLRIAKQREIAEKFVMTSNASLLSPDKARALVDNGLDFLRVSIYGADTTSYRQRTGTKIDLCEIIENLRYLKEYRDSVGGALSIAVKMLDSGDPAENQRFLDAFSSVGDDCFIEPLHNWHDKDMHFSSAGRAERKVCPYPFYTLVVHADLAVSVCCPDWNKQLCIGNLRFDSLKEIWEGDKLRSLQLALLDQDFSSYPVCRHCDFYKINAGDDLDSLNSTTFLARIYQR